MKARSSAVQDALATADDILEIRRARTLPDVAAQAAQAANALAKLAADRAMLSGGAEARVAASRALETAEACIRSLIDLEIHLADADDLADMSRRIGRTLGVAAEAALAAGDALALCDDA